MKVNGLATKGKVLDNPFSGKAVTAYCARLAVCFFHKVTLIQPEVYLGNVLLDIYHIKIICEYLRKDTTQQLLCLHDAKITNTYEIMRLRGEGIQLGFTTDPLSLHDLSLKEHRIRGRDIWGQMIHSHSSFEEQHTHKIKKNVWK